MGQHFLTDLKIAQKMVEVAAVKSGDKVVEIGPGKGALTYPLLKAGDEVIAIEKDRELGEALRAKKLKNLKIIIDNALFALPRLNLDKYKIVSNLPYSITSPVIRILLEGDKDNNPPPPEIAVLMIQKEVAERLTAKPGSRERGVLTVMAEYYASNIEIIEIVSAAKFKPQPKVDSAIIKISGINRHPDHPFLPAYVKASAGRHSSIHPFIHQSIHPFFRLVKSGFAGKRQILENSLSRGLKIPKAEIAALLQKSGISAGRRAEDLSLEQWLKLADSISHIAYSK